MALFKLTSSVFTGGNVFNLRSCLLPHLNTVNISAAGLKQQSSPPVMNIPNRPKKPLSPYFKFQGLMRHKIIEKNPSIKVIEIPKVVSAEWKKISVADKSKLESEYAKEKEIYVQAVKKYEDQLTPEAIEFLRKEKAERKQKKEKREMKKLFRETGKPKKPGNSFYLFIKDIMTKTEYQNRSYMSLIPTCAKLWADLGESEKQKYVQEYQKKYEKYKRDLLKWEETLIREGKLERIETKGSQTTLSKNKDKK
uniref:Transcription factor A, mitochondrial n=1 Tax=Cacopsylla melanoneura TaxID=428564 RepID=A0A8D9B0P3_9HEMI